VSSEVLPLSWITSAGSCCWPLTARFTSQANRACPAPQRL